MKLADIGGKQHLAPIRLQHRTECVKPARLLCQQLHCQKPPHINCLKNRLLTFEQDFFPVRRLLKDLGILLPGDLTLYQFELICS